MKKERTISDAIKIVLKDKPEGMTVAQIYSKIIENRLYEFNAQNPLSVVTSTIRSSCVGVDNKFTTRVREFIIVKEDGDNTYYALNSVSYSEWWPTPEEYDPGFSVEDWLELFKDKTVFTDDSMKILTRILEMGGEASCKELSEKYGEDPNYYNKGSSALGRRIHKKTNCPLMTRDTGGSSWWTVLYLGKNQEAGKKGEFVWKLREELKEALEIKESSDHEINEKLIYSLEDIKVFHSDARHKNYFVPIIDALFQMGGKAKRTDVHKKVVDICNISEEELGVKNKSNQSVVINDIDWARNYLNYEGFIENNSPNGIWALSEIGQKYEMTEELAEKIIVKWVKITTARRKNEPEPIIDLTPFYKLRQNPVLKSDNKDEPVIWKISHGTNRNGIPEHLRSVLVEKKVVVVHQGTMRLAAQKLPQGQVYMNEIKKGDYFYLCYAGEIVLFGQFTENVAKVNKEMIEEYNDYDWYERSYRVIANSLDHNKYTGKKKLWTSNYNSTCVKVDDNKLFEELILKPYFGLSISDLNKTEYHDPYTKQDFLNDVYMSEARYDELKALLKNKQNIILQGAPGVGKTFSAERLAYSIMGEKDDSRIEFIQFHQNYSYEDFIMGYRPNDEGGFSLKEGVFYRFCEKAMNDANNRPYFFIIDEINRGNLSKIFGELLMLIEKDYRKRSAKLAYRDEYFSVPGNLYIIGMMNTADRSLALIDYALRRRFSFFEMEPGFDSDGLKKYATSLNNAKFNELIKQIVELNAAIIEDKSLGKGFRIGHSYFCGRNAEICTIDWLRSVVKYDIMPTLEEYWFDDLDKVSKWETNLNGALND